SALRGAEALRGAAARPHPSRGRRQGPRRRVAQRRPDRRCAHHGRTPRTRPVVPEGHDPRGAQPRDPSRVREARLPGPEPEARPHRAALAARSRLGETPLPVARRSGGADRARARRGTRMTLPPVREFALENGFRTLLVERRSLPLVATALYYRVGSRDERTGETGMSHFLEHMMFKGTARLRKGEIDALTSKLGGSNNAFTDKDCT